MVRVFQDRAAPHGKEIDALFMLHMKEVHEVSRKKADKNKLGVVAPPRKKDRLILSDFNIGAYMAQMEEPKIENESAEDDKRDHNDSSNEDKSEEEGNMHAEEV
jgi:hypothetical protein